MFGRRSVGLILGGAAAIVLVLGTATFATADSGPSAKEIEVTDDCDPATFNAAIGPGTCVGDGDTTFDDFIEQLIEEGEADDWEFHPDELEFRAGRGLFAVNEGGEFHTFTEVAVFGGGCVLELNALLGLTPVAECDDPSLFGTTGLAPGDTLQVNGLATGKHRFMCLIHPWMRSEVRVRRR